MRIGSWLSKGQLVAVWDDLSKMEFSEMGLRK